MKLLSCLILTAVLGFGQASAEVELKAAMHKELSLQLSPNQHNSLTRA